MVIRTEYRGQRYSMGSSDPLPAGFEIRFGSLNFSGHGERLPHAHHQPRRTPCAAANRANPGPRRTCRWGTNARQHGCCGPSAPRRRRRSDQRSRQARTERRRAARAALQATRPPARRQPFRRGSTRFQDRDSPSTSVAPRQRTSPPPTPTRRRAGFALAAMFRPSGIPAPPPTTSRPTAPPASYHPPPHTGTRSGTSPVCLTQ
jgi:hypothetical protein